jgi:hypothetical protein
MTHITFHIARNFNVSTPFALILTLVFLAGCVTPRNICNQKVTTNHYVCKAVEICDSNSDAVCRMEQKCELEPIEQCFSWTNNPDYPPLLCKYFGIFCE